MSFAQELILSLVGALSTALLVTIGGGWIAARLTRQHDEGRRNYDTRTRLVDTCNQEVSAMWQLGRRVRMDQHAGMAVARAKGKLKGRQPKLSKKQQQAELVRMHEAGDHSIADLADVFSISRPTFYRTINRVHAERA